MDELKKPVKWETLSEEKKKEIQNVYYYVEQLTIFSNKANQKLFVYLYGEQMGNHLWEKFRSFDGDMFKFIKYLDVENKTILMSNVFNFDERRSNGANPLYNFCN